MYVNRHYLDFKRSCSIKLSNFTSNESGPPAGNKPRSPNSSFSCKVNEVPYRSDSSQRWEDKKRECSNMGRLGIEERKQKESRKGEKYMRMNKYQSEAG